MSISATTINNFLKQQVKAGVCSSIEEAQKQLASKLAEMRLDRNIKEAREDYKKGRYETLDDQWIENYVLESSKKLLSHNH
ncbi:MAG: hypothetical protein V4612_03575 [Pseudomonadota bacterium]